MEEVYINDSLAVASCRWAQAHVAHPSTKGGSQSAQDDSPDRPIIGLLQPN
jgi:hypothetical protein